MIDQNLIDVNVENLKHSVSIRTPTKIDGLFRITDVLEPIILQKLHHYLSTVDDQIWSKIENQNKLCRSKITWHAETVVEEMHEIFQSLTPTINEIFSGTQKNFWGISLWRDLPGYKMEWHTDNPDIDVAIQIYLYGHSGLGTVFGTDSDPVLIDGIHNSGYLAVYSGQNQIIHRTENVVPPGIIRHSLYAVWSRSPKHFANT